MSTLTPQNKRTKPRKLGDITFADDLTELRKLKPYLCSAVYKRGSHRGVQVNVCRTCEAQCAYGRKYVRLWDEQQAREKEQPTMAKAETTTVQERLEAKARENMDLHNVNQKLLKEVKALEEQLAEQEKKLDRLRLERTSQKLEVWKLKARLYDLEHPEEE